MPEVRYGCEVGYVEKAGAPVGFCGPCCVLSGCRMLGWLRTNAGWTEEDGDGDWFGSSFEGIGHMQRQDGPRAPLRTCGQAT